MEELQRKLEEYKKENEKRIKELESEIEKMKEDKEVEREKRVQKYDAYYYIAYNRVVSTQESYSLADNGNYEIGNYFLTKEEAEKALEKARIYNKLKRFAEGNNTEEIDWDGNRQYKYYIYYDCCSEVLAISSCCVSKEIGQIYFNSRELAEQAIEKIGEENIKKLFE